MSPGYIHACFPYLIGECLDAVDIVSVSNFQYITQCVSNSAMAFFRDGLGLPVIAANDKYAQVQAGPTNIVLKAVDG
jgi:hypothetical protein